MSLACLVYASRAKAPFTVEQLAQLTRNSAERNAFRDITGALLYCDGYFLQMLEGADWMVRELFNKISKDPRHYDVQEISCRSIPARSFGGWGMSCLHESLADAIDQKKIRSITRKVEAAASPNHLAEDAQCLLTELKQAIERQSSLVVIERAA